MSDFVSSFQSNWKKFDNEFGNTNFVQKLEKKTNIPRNYLFSGFLSFYLLMSFLNLGGIGEILSDIVGSAIPTYYSIRAIKTNDTRDDTQLLAYWIIFGIMNVVEFWSGAILSLIPFYWFLKIIFLLYIGLPFTGGSIMIWKHFIEPVYDQLESRVVSAAAASSSSKKSGSQRASSAMREAVEKASGYAREASSRH